MKIKYILSLVICLFFSALAMAQTGKVRGFVIDKETDAPIPFANIVVQGTSTGAVANDEGYFILSNVPLGKQTIEISFLGYETITEEVVVSETRIASVKIYMGTSSELLQDVEVSADRQERETKVLTGVVSLDPKEIQQFSVGGDADIIKAIQVLPGVVTTGDQGGQLYIRGGAPIQNLIMLDGMIVYNPFHSIGFFSVFDADIIQSADVYTGGFNAEYGSRNSAVMDVRTRVANRKKMSGKLFASTYSSKLLLETPMGKKNERGMAPLSFMVSAKTSYLEQSSKVFYPYVETEYDGLPFNFTDIYAKMSSQSDNGSKFNVFGFSFDDGVRFGSDNSIDWNSLGAGFNFTAVPASSSVLIDGNASYSNYSITSIEGAGQSPKESGISGFNGGLDFTYFLRENDQFKYGLEAITYRTSLKIPPIGLGTFQEKVENTTEFGVYTQYKFTANRLIIEPGFRVHYYSSQDEASFEPRLGLKYTVLDWLRVKASAGLYSQNLFAANSDRDVVNLFYGFLSGPDDGEIFNVGGSSTVLQKSKHVVAGFEIEISKEITLNIEGYIKDFDQIINVNRNQIYSNSTNAANNDIADIYEKPYVAEQGLAKGIDFLATYRTKKLYVWAAYSLSKVTRDDGLQEYYPYFDRRHNLNLVGNYTFGEDGAWEFSLRYNFGTGFPFTPTQGYYSQQTFIDNSGNAQPSLDLTTANGNPAVIYGDLNAKRLPNYHRVDMSIKRTIKLKNENVIELAAGATNILNYDNIFYWDREENKRVNQLPIMPTVSLTYSF